MGNVVVNIDSSVQQVQGKLLAIFYTNYLQSCIFVYF